MKSVYICYNYVYFLWSFIKKYIYFANKKREKKKELNHSLALYSSAGLGHGGDSGALLLPDPLVDLVLSSACFSVTCAECLRPASHWHLRLSIDTSVF